jgi:hypothetical protein
MVYIVLATCQRLPDVSADNYLCVAVARQLVSLWR